MGGSEPIGDANTLRPTLVVIARRRAATVCRDDDDDVSPTMSTPTVSSVSPLALPAASRLATKMTKATTVMMLLAGMLATSSCGKHLYSRDDLTVDLSKHHIDLRWGRIENAAQRVMPEMRGPFVQVWAGRLQSLEIQDLEVVGLALTDEDTAEVVVAVTVVDKSTMGVKVMQFPERWTRTENGWRLATVAELPEG